MTAPAVDRTFGLMFLVMLTVAAANTALQSVLPALGRSLGVRDQAVAAAFSVSALLWVLAAPFWANRSDRYGRRAMILLGMGGLVVSLLVCGLFLALGINRVIPGATAFGLFIFGRLIYGSLGAAAPPAVQALVAGSTTREQRTKALTLLASAFGLGTILGPAIAPYLILGSIGSVEIGLSGPAFIMAGFGLLVLFTVRAMLPDDRPHPGEGGAQSAYPSIGGAPSGGSVRAATAAKGEAVGFLDRRVRAWMITGLVMGHAQAMTSQAIGFLVIDRLQLAPAQALEPTGIVLMMGAGASLLVQWGMIPLLNLNPRQLVLAGLSIAAAGHGADRDRDVALRHRDRLRSGQPRLRVCAAGLYRGIQSGGGSGGAGVGCRQGHQHQRRQLRTGAIDRRRAVRSAAFAAIPDRSRGKHRDDRLLLDDVAERRAGAGQGYRAGRRLNHASGPVSPCSGPGGRVHQSGA
jgi:MFS family permease